jgi:hypothetical protein
MTGSAIRASTGPRMAMISTYVVASAAISGTTAPEATPARR